MAEDVVAAPPDAGAVATAEPTATTGDGDLPADLAPAELLREIGIPWTELLSSAEMRKDGTVGRYATLDDAGKALIEQHKALSAGPGLKPPGPDATAQQVDRWREATGVPKDPSAYTLPENLDPTLSSEFRTLAHKLHMPGASVQQLADWYVKAEQGRLDRVQQEWVGELDKLRQEWGEPLYKQNVTAAVRFVEAMAQEAGLEVKDVKSWLDASRLGDHPMLFRMLATAGQKMIEDKLIMGDQSAVGDAKSQIEAIRADPSHPLNPANHRGDPGKREQWDDLYKLAYGLGPATR